MPENCVCILQIVVAAAADPLLLNSGGAASSDPMKSEGSVLRFIEVATARVVLNLTMVGSLSSGPAPDQGVVALSKRKGQWQELEIGVHCPLTTSRFNGFVPMNPCMSHPHLS